MNLQEDVKINFYLKIIILKLILKENLLKLKKILQFDGIKLPYLIGLFLFVFVGFIFAFLALVIELVHKSRVDAKFNKVITYSFLNNQRIVLLFNFPNN